MDLTDQKRSRRTVIKSIVGSILAIGAGMFGMAQTKPDEKRTIKRGLNEDQSTTPLISQYVIHGGLVYVKGMGEHDEEDITKATTAVLDKVEEQLKKAGSSMDKVLKVNVFLYDLADYEAMNEAYRGRFGDEPPVRTTVACYGGIPGNSLVEIDAIAALNDD